MSELDERLERGPLRVRSVWTPELPERVSRRVLRARRVKLALSAGAGACVLALLPLLWTRHSAVPPLEVASSPSPRQVKAAPSPTVLRGAAPEAFAGGALAELSGEGAELVVEQDSPERVVARLSGKGRFRVLPKPGRSVEIRIAELRMRVLGSSFSVEELAAGGAHVAVERGQVEVAWLGGRALLESGQSGTFPPVQELEPAPAPRQYRMARAEPRDEAGELMQAADAARLGGQPELAVEPLKRIYERHPRDRRAPVAAFSLGRVLLDDLHRPAQAAAAFQKARALWPKGPLAPDALAREAEARAAAGQHERAGVLAEQYLARQPSGRHAAAMRKLVAR